MKGGADPYEIVPLMRIYDPTDRNRISHKTAKLLIAGHLLLAAESD